MLYAIDGKMYKGEKGTPWQTDTCLGTLANHNPSCDIRAQAEALYIPFGEFAQLTKHVVVFGGAEKLQYFTVA